MKELSQKAAAILGYINQRSADGVPPTVREICADLQIKSTSTAHKYLCELEEKGYISRREGLNRSIRLSGSEPTLQVPLLGSVTAGQPILAFEELTGYVPYAASGSPEQFFALRVRGDSMVKAGILDGDTIVVRKCPSAENGQIVVALIDDEATVKRFFKEDGRYRLQPENDAMAPIYADRVSVLGRVVSVVRHYE